MRWLLWTGSCRAPQPAKFALLSPPPGSPAKRAGQSPAAPSRGLSRCHWAWHCNSAPHAFWETGACGERRKFFRAVGWVGAATAVSRQVESIAPRVTQRIFSGLGCWVTREAARGAMFVHSAALTQPTFCLSRLTTIVPGWWCSSAGHGPCSLSARAARDRSPEWIMLLAWRLFRLRCERAPGVLLLERCPNN